jgi:tripartite ATP-independent transporter DctM subunit
MVVTFVASMLLGVPIAFVLGLVGMVGLAQMGPEFLMAVPQRLFTTANNYSLLAIPMFILAGELLGLSGDVSRLMNFCRALIGRIKGGIAYVTIVVGLMLGGILGMANAEAALLSATIYPEMLKDGYEDDFAAPFIASVSVVGPLIPPGLLYVIYGVCSGTSIAELFMSGIVPGLLVGFALAFVIFMLSRNPKRNWTVTSWSGWDNAWRNLKSASFSIAAPFLTFVTVAAGIATPTESASVIVVAVALVGIIVYKKIKLKDLIPMLINSAVTSGAILIISAMAGILGWVLALDQIPQKVAMTMISISDNRIVILVIIQIFLLLVGMFMDAAPAVMILVPVFLPLIRQYGYNPAHFGLLMCFNLTIGVLTPPVGTCLYTTAMATGISVDRMIRAIWPWIGVLVAVLLLCTYFESVVMFVPNLLRG